MSIIKSSSRLSHHTITVPFDTSNPSFTIPASEDFTDGSWSIYDLALSEIGVNEFSEEVYIRIGNTIQQIALSGDVSALNISEVVNNGNVLSSGQSIKGFTEDYSIDIDAGFRVKDLNIVDNLLVVSADNIFLSSDGVGTGADSVLYLTNTGLTLGYSGSGNTLDMNASGISAVSGDQYLLMNDSDGITLYSLDGFEQAVIYLSHTYGSASDVILVASDASVSPSGSSESTIRHIVYDSSITNTTTMTKDKTSFSQDIQIAADKGLQFGSQSRYYRLTLNIGDWDMDTNGTTTVAHSLSATEYKTIRSIKVIIRNDADTIYYDFYNKLTTAAVTNVDSTNVNLERDTAGQFDGTDFNSTSYNRGFIVLEYTPD